MEKSDLMRKLVNLISSQKQKNINKFEKTEKENDFSLKEDNKMDDIFESNQQFKIIKKRIIRKKN